MHVLIIDNNDTTLKRLENYTGPLPQVGQEIVFLSGEGVFVVTQIAWQTSKEDWYDFTCHILVRSTLVPLARWNGETWEETKDDNPPKRT